MNKFDDSNNSGNQCRTNNERDSKADDLLKKLKANLSDNTPSQTSAQQVKKNINKDNMTPAGGSSGIAPDDEKTTETDVKQKLEQLRNSLNQLYQSDKAAAVPKTETDSDADVKTYIPGRMSLRKEVTIRGNENKAETDGGIETQINTSSESGGVLNGEKPESDAADGVISAAKESDPAKNDDAEAETENEKRLKKKLAAALENVAAKTEKQEKAPESDESISNSDIEELFNKYIHGRAKLTETENTAVKAPESASANGRKAESGNMTDIGRSIKDAELYVANMQERSDQAEQKTLDRGAETTEETKADEIDEVDASLTIAFGMEDTVTESGAIKKISEIESDINKKFGHLTDKAIQNGESIKREFEYTSPTQTKELIKNYKKTYSSVLIRFLGCALLFIITFFYENIGMFGGKLPAPVHPDIYPAIHILINLQFLILCGALIYKSLYNGMISLLKLKPTPESVTFTLMAFTVLYHLVVYLLGVNTNIQMYNFPMIMCAAMNVVYDFMNLKREIYSFNIACSKRVKYAIDTINTNKTELENDTFYSYLPNNPVVLKVKKASFIDGFYKRINDYPKNKKILNIVIPVVITISVLFFIFSYYLNRDLHASVTVMYMTLMICMPFSIFVTYSYPFYKASKDAYGIDSAIIGEKTLEEYSAAAAISFDDKDVFPSRGVKVKSVKVSDNHRLDQVIYNTASLFRHLGGPLADVFDVTTYDSAQNDKVDLIEVAEDGIEAMVGKEHILIGKASYIMRSELQPMNPEEDEKIEDNGEVSVLYVAYQNEVAAKLYIQYNIDPDFDYILRQLYKAGMCIGIKTFDPNINDAMLSAKVRISKYPVKVIRCHSLEDQIQTADHIESGIISKASAKSLLQTLSVCDKVLHITKTNLVVKTFAIMISIIIMVFVLTLGMSSEINSFYVVLYQIFWSIPMIIIARLFI